MQRLVKSEANISNIQSTCVRLDQVDSNLKKETADLNQSLSDKINNLKLDHT